MPSYPKIFLTEDANKYSPKEVNRGNSLVEETSSLQLETSKFPDILKIALNEKIIKNDLNDCKCRSISSEMKSGSCNSEVNTKPKSSRKLKAIGALSSSNVIESNEADNLSNMPTRLVPASEQNGQATVERMEPEHRTRVQRSRSDGVIFSQIGKQERNFDEGLSNFRTCEEEHHSVLSCSEANIIQRPTRTSPSTEELRVSSGERKRPCSAQDSASAAVEVSDHRDRSAQKQNLRELKSLLSKILASPLLHPGTSNDDDDDDKNQHPRNGSKIDLNATFVKPSLTHNLISEEELPPVCSGDSMNPSIIPSNKIVVDMNSASDGSKEVARSFKPKSETLGKVSSVTGHTRNLLSCFFKVQSNKPDLPETTSQICNSLSGRKTELSARRSDNHTGEKTTREDELCTVSQKMSPSHELLRIFSRRKDPSPLLTLGEKAPDENHLKLHRSSVVTGSKCLKSSDQRSVPNAGRNWSLTPKSSKYW